MLKRHRKLIKEGIAAAHKNISAKYIQTLFFDIVSCKIHLVAQCFRPCGAMPSRNIGRNARDNDWAKQIMKVFGETDCRLFNEEMLCLLLINELDLAF